ncbi:hypothetical protein M8J77_004121 [Diaphorina citri]|nr:hypothetical protein M8J77_004121 [Diaphorina citri]
MPGQTSSVNTCVLLRSKNLLKRSSRGDSDVAQGGCSIKNRPHHLKLSTKPVLPKNQRPECESPFKGADDKLWIITGDEE